ncbi:LacI family DNA-binding transcriptional regulator [Enterococcus cecorum]|uniref:LacI family DNA-binding transcriptional regulator n=1 Tax=Enterococcus cecorum TaxID=44008 RepID=UPI0025A3B164|nr:LacI family DNA-binding transcriptional regulator [Enterococcus cecorum]MDM8183669.1 LacI family DNA-binding transcriptional regulator [Enterococcus cecorum]
MKTKKVTIKDIAKEAGVSIATVSYIINDRKDQQISPETRNKVLQVINLLNYTPNKAAKSLVTNQTQSIALYCAETGSFLEKAEQLTFIQKLSAFLHTKNYNLVYLDNHMIQKYDMVDAILTLGIDNTSFHQIGELNFVPIIALDGLVNDPVFFQINLDWQHIVELLDSNYKDEQYTLVSLPIYNKELKSYLSSIFKQIYWLTQSNLALDDTKYLVTVNQAIKDFYENSKSIQLIPKFTDTYFEKLFQTINWAINRDQIENHNILI